MVPAKVEAAPLPERRRRFSTIVLGAGIFGAALAHHLTQEGEREILLYDRAFPTAGASGKGAGILSSQCWDRWDIRAVEETRAEYRALAEAWKPGTFAVYGGLRTAASRAGEALLEARAADLRAENDRLRDGRPSA